MSREYNYDILRILSMFGIISMHCLGLLVPITSGSANGIVIDFINTLSYMAVNVFGIISGYFGIKASRHSTLFQRIVQVLFYCLAISISYYLIIGGLTKIELIEYVFPFINGRLWYFWAYCFCFIISPALNRFLINISRRNHLHLIVVLFVLLSLITTLLNVDLFRIVNSGYSAAWIIYLYIIGAYIRNYGFQIKIKWYFCILIIMVNTIIVMLSKQWLADLNDIIIWDTNFLYKYSNPLILVNGCLTTFLFSKPILINNTIVGKTIRHLSKVSFAVYIIHANPLVLDKFFYKIKFFSYIYSSGLILCFIYIIITLLGVYLICTIIESIREKMFQLLRINVAFEKVDKLLFSYISID